MLVGGTAVATYVDHRESMDHDHVLSELSERYEEVFEAVSASAGWATSVRASRPPLTLLGTLDGINAGLRQLRRTRPLEIQRLHIAPDIDITIPTEPELLRIKAYLIVQRRALRDYLDVAALTDHLGIVAAASTLAEIEGYYNDRSEVEGSVLTELILALTDVDPVDGIADLDRYRVRNPRWSDIAAITEICNELALRLAEVTPVAEVSLDD